MRSKFDSQLELLNKDLIEMGALCEEAIAAAATSLNTGNLDDAERAAELESEIDRMEHSIESLCLKLLLQQQPVAGDLRQISAALKMITDMERIGDQASDIAEIVRFLHGRNGSDFTHINEMARATIKMVTDSVDAFVKRDLDLARSVKKHDEIVDDYFDEVKKSLIAEITAVPEDAEYALDLLMIAKYLERIGDHAENISEWVEFSVTGIHK